MENLQNHEVQSTNQPAKKQGISTVAGIIIIVAVALILFGGVFAYQFLFVKPQTDGLPSQSQQATAGWKTYHNDGCGFEFMYPDDFVILKENTGNYCDIQLRGGTFDNMGVFVNLPSGFESGTDYKPTEDFVVDGNNVKIWHPSGENYTTNLYGSIITFGRNGNTYGIWGWQNKGTIAIEEAQDKLFKQIASTFKFTNPAGQANDSSQTLKINGNDYRFTFTTNSVKVVDAMGNFLQEIIIGTNEMDGARFDLEQLGHPIVSANDDVNFDGYKDLAIDIGTGYAGVNFFYNFYLFTPKDKKFKEVAELSVCNPIVEADKRQILSSCKSGPGYEEKVYKFIPELGTYAVEVFPVIFSVNPTSGSIGSTASLFGRDFAGFEGDLNLWIENSAVVKGIIYGEKGSDDSNIIFKVPASVCQQDNSYSGLPCSATLQLTPGNYKIFVRPWGNESNKVNFEIK